MKSKTETPSRTVLPIPDRPFTGPVMFDAEDPNSKFPPIEPLRPPKGAPNVLRILLDDAGFAAMNRFAGPCSAATAPHRSATTTARPSQSSAVR
jgi:arylsulfatase